jgi:hypothetical protein
MEKKADPVPGDRAKPASPVRVAAAVFWSFLGIRKRAGHEADVAQLKLAQVVVAGVVGATIFVLSLILLVKFVVGKLA